MKKIFTLFLSVATMATIFTGCSKDEEAPVGPTISFNTTQGTTGNVTVEPGDSVAVGVIMSAGDANLDRLRVTYSYDGANALEYDTEDLSGESGTYTTTIGTRNVEGTERYTFTVTDNDGLTNNVAFTITTEGNIGLGTEFTGQFFHMAGATGCTGAYDLVNNLPVSSLSSDDNKDMENTDAAGATFTGSFEAQNDTRFVKSNSTDYATASESVITAAYDAGTPSATVTNPAVNDVFIAKLRGDDDYAIIKITALSPNDETCSPGTTNKGKITFKYKKTN